MGLRTFIVSAEREAVEVTCDARAHDNDNTRTAWFDCGSNDANLELAIAAGWRAGVRDEAKWLCPQCAEEAHRIERPTKSRRASSRR
jgi:hypothetical protein